MKLKFEKIIEYLIGSEKGDEPLSKVNIPGQFQQGENDSHAIARNLNAAFLIVLSGESHCLYNQASGYLIDFQDHPVWGKTVRFYKDGLELIRSEISDRCYVDERFEKDLTNFHSWIINQGNRRNYKATVEKIRQVFFPEGVSLCDTEKREEKVKLLRKKREIRLTALNPSPITNPAKEILFTSNILVTLPPASKGIDSQPVSDYLKQRLKQVAQEDQEYWYDHPIPIGVAPEHNEALYGLEGLDKAVEFEKQRGTAGKDERLTCVLSVSVTHEGLQGIIKEYLEDEFKKEKNIKHLNVYVFTEVDTIKLIEKILIPALEKYLGVEEHGILYEIIGVDGEYGRHYSFLKAVSAFWQVFIAPEIKGTFKIDLDQVFPQKALVEQSGASAFEHLKAPLWGAEGIDSRGNEVELGMIAGALVNKKDIEKKLFCPDVCFPPDKIKADEIIFFSTLPQALSTEAEMMTRYTEDSPDGKKQCIQRIHVTGGTCGVMIDSLRKYQPFTPISIGRAEDQAYIMSVLFNSSQKNLRYVHKDGLIMRHDKEAFAGEAIKTAATGKLIGDYIRILLFSYYARALPWSLEDIKNEIDPFTGCFVSKIPLTVVYLRFALRAASLFNEDTKEKNQQGFELLQTGMKRLHDIIQKLVKEPDHLAEQFQREKQGWRLFYNIIETVERNLSKKDAFALDLQKRAKSLIEACRINFKGG